MGNRLCNCYQNTEAKFAEAANEYLIHNPAAEYREVRTKIKNKFNPDLRSCSEFRYSGTIWCDNCGHEKGCHPVAVMPCADCRAKIPAIVGTVPICDDCLDMRLNQP